MLVGNMKKKNFPWAITNSPLGYYNRSPPGLDPNTPWYTAGGFTVHHEIKAVNIWLVFIRLIVLKIQKKLVFINR